MNVKQSVGLSIVVFSFAFSGCNSLKTPTDSNMSDGFVSGYIKEIQQTKQAGSSDVDIDSKIKSINSRYAFLGNEKERLNESVAYNTNSVSLKKVSTIRPDSKMNKQVNNSLAKENSVLYSYLGVKWGTYTVERPYFEMITVPAGGYIDVGIKEPSSTSVDPFLVIYSIDNGNPMQDFDLQQCLTVRAWNDDYNVLLSRARWDNTTGSNQNVVVLVFAYSSYGAGTAKVSITLNTGALSDRNINVVGKATFNEYGYLAPSGVGTSKPSNYVEDPVNNICIATSSSLSSLYPGYLWGSYAPGASSEDVDTYIWRFDFSSLRGMANDDIQEGVAQSCLVNWFAGLPLPSNYPNVTLYGGWQAGGTAKFLEVKRFSVTF